MKPCLCRGTNENCNFCYGTGYIVDEPVSVTSMSAPNSKVKRRSDVHEVFGETSQPKQSSKALKARVKEKKRAKQKRTIAKASVALLHNRSVAAGRKFDALLNRKVNKLIAKGARHAVAEIIMQPNRSVFQKCIELNKLVIQLASSSTFSGVEITRLVEKRGYFRLAVHRNYKRKEN